LHSSSVTNINSFFTQFSFGSHVDYIPGKKLATVKIFKLADLYCFEYFKTTPPVKSCCVETRDRFFELMPCLKSGRPLPKITGAIPIRYSSNRLSSINVSERLALPKT